MRNKSILFQRSFGSGAIDIKMNESVHDKNKCIGPIAASYFLPLAARYTRYLDNCKIFFVIISFCYKDVYINSFFHQTARLSSSLLTECLPLTKNLFYENVTKI